MTQMIIEFFSHTSFLRAWSKILNFSDDQGARPEKAAILWKWLMEHIKNKKEKEQEKEEKRKNNVSSFQNIHFTF